MFVHFLYLFCTIFVQSFGNLDSPLFICPRYPKGLQIDNVMASIKFSGFGLTEIAGKVGGCTVQRNGSGAFLKRSSNPGRGRSMAQYEQKAAFSTLSNRWRALAESQRLSWNQSAASGQWVGYNRLGDARNITGFMLYMELNGNLQIVNGGLLSVPPVKVPFTSVGIDFIAVNGNDGDFIVSFTGDPPEATMIISSCATLAVGTSRYSNLALFDRRWVSDGKETYDKYAAVFGNAIVGGILFVELELIMDSTGQRQSIGVFRVPVV